MAAELTSTPAASANDPSSSAQRRKPPVPQPAGRLLDAGCGTGGFLRWALDEGSFAEAAGVDVSSAAIELARQRVPEATFDVAPLWTLPHEDGAFNLIVMNDVLQHIPEDRVNEALAELRRTLAPGAALLVRTNGSRKLRRERDDWRAYDAASLRKALADGGFHVRRLTYANMALSAWGQVRGRIPHAPTEEQHGIPTEPDRLRSAIGLATLRREAWLLGHSRARLPFGHALFALAVVPDRQG
jgi:SAM-dependent methyltransferase